MLGATFVKRPANSLEVAGSVGCSAPIDPDGFWLSVTLLHFHNNVGPTPWTSLRRLAVTVPCGTWYRARGTAFICVMPCLLTSIAFLQFLIVVNTSALAPRVTEVHWFWASILLSPRSTIEIYVSLFCAEIFLFRNPDCLFQGIKFQL